MGKIILVTGGASSGKSEFAESLLEKIKYPNKRPLYIATSRIFDEEMQEKKLKHIKRRETFDWESIEIYEDVGKILSDESFFGKKILLDCITMLITNIIFGVDENFDGRDKILSQKIEDRVMCQIKEILDAIRKNEIDMIFVTNEVGLSVVSENPLSRFFVRLSGEVNKLISKNSDEVYFVVSGIPMKIK